MTAPELANRVERASVLLAAMADLLVITAKSITEVAKTARELSADLKDEDHAG